MNALKGAAVTVVSSLIVALLFAYVFRVPIPFWAYIGPFGEASTYGLNVADVVKHVFLAWLMYGALGGFMLLAVGGSLTGAIVGRKYAGSAYQNRMIVLWAIGVSAVPVFVLAILDYVIGPW